nr:MAG TPA: hypothetical protein [Caudoviricetes sp.]
MNGLREIERNIYVTKEILLHEYAYYYGDRKDEIVEFVYYNIKRDRESVKEFTYKEALDLARQRRADGRYKNYEYWIRDRRN